MGVCVEEQGRSVGFPVRAHKCIILYNQVRGAYLFTDGSRAGKWVNRGKRLKIRPGAFQVFPRSPEFRLQGRGKKLCKWFTLVGGVQQVRNEWSGCRGGTGQDDPVPVMTRPFGRARGGVRAKPESARAEIGSLRGND